MVPTENICIHPTRVVFVAILFKLLNWRQHKNLMCLLGCFSSVLYFAFPHTYSAFNSTVSARDLQNSLILNSYECGCIHWNLDNIFTARTNNCILTVRFSRLSSFLFVLLFSFRVAVRLSPLLLLFLFSFRITARLPPLLFLLLF